MVREKVRSGAAWYIYDIQELIEELEMETGAEEMKDELGVVMFGNKNDQRSNLETAVGAS